MPTHLLSAMAVLLFLVQVPTASGEPADCATCHKVEHTEFAASIHTSLSCQECHGGPTEYDIPATQRAQLIARKADWGLTFDHGSTFSGKPKRQDIPNLCGSCHANVERMNPFGMRTDQLARYWTSGHGKTLKEQGDDRVAICTDCHGTHEIRPGHEPGAKTHPFNVPATCGECHADSKLMGDFDLPTEVVDEYRQSVHGQLLLDQGDSGAPTCATCHGNHSAMPPGFTSVSTVCGKCHDHVNKFFATSIHATQEGHRGCVQCHGGGEGRHFHLIERITKTPGVLIQRYSHLLEKEPNPTPDEITEAINAKPKEIIMRAMPTCTDCHDDLEDDESLPKLLEILDGISEAERYYAQTADRLEKVGQGVLLVENQRFLFDDAKTQLIGLAPLQHTLNNDKVKAKVAELNAVCDQVNAELDTLEDGLRLRYVALIPIWAFAVLFSVILYVKYKQLKRQYVTPLPSERGA